MSTLEVLVTRLEAIEGIVRDVLLSAKTGVRDKVLHLEHRVEEVHTKIDAVSKTIAQQEKEQLSQKNFRRDLVVMLIMFVIAQAITILIAMGFFQHSQSEQGIDYEKIKSIMHETTEDAQ